MAMLFGYLKGHTLYLKNLTLKIAPYLKCLFFNLDVILILGVVFPSHNLAEVVHKNKPC